MKQGGTFSARKRNARSMKPDETERDRKRQYGTMWDGMGRRKTVWDGMGRRKTVWDNDEKANGFLGGTNANHKISNNNTSNSTLQTTTR